MTIRRLRSEDAQVLYEAVRESVESVSEWMSWCHPRYSFADSQAFAQSRDAEWDKGDHYSFAIVDAASKQFLGVVGLNHFNRLHKFANLGYWVRKSQTGRGVASLAARLAARFGVEELGLHRVEIVVAVGNLPSQRVAEKTRARREGILRQRLCIHEVMHDAVMFSLVAEDLKA